MEKCPLFLHAIPRRFFFRSISEAIPGGNIAMPCKKELHGDYYVPIKPGRQSKRFPCENSEWIFAQHGERKVRSFTKPLFLGLFFSSPVRRRLSSLIIPFHTRENWINC
jgi:hypothetical protein